METKSEKKMKKECAKTYLTKTIKPADTLVIVIKSVSRSGMARRMRIVHDDHDITYWIADLCDLPINAAGILVTGCGMDMTFWLANDITNNLYGLDTPKGLRGNGGSCLAWIAV